MRASALAPVALVISSLMIALPAQAADEHEPNIKGLYLMTDYPAVTIRPGTTSNIPLRLQNYGLAPDRYQLSVSGVPSGWTATILGGGQPVAAAMPAPDKDVSLQLRLDVPANSKLDGQTLTIKAEGQGNQASLPIQVALAKELPAKLSVKAQLPSLRGSPKSNFEYTLSIKNDSGRDVTASFAAQAPENFETSFTEAYGTQELSSIPIPAGQSKDIKIKVTPPRDVKAGNYPVTVKVAAEGATAEQRVTLQISGQGRLHVMLQAAAHDQQARCCGPRNDQHQGSQQQNACSDSWTLFPVEHRMHFLTARICSQRRRSSADSAARWRLVPAFSAISKSGCRQCVWLDRSCIPTPHSRALPGSGRARRSPQNTSAT